MHSVTHLKSAIATLAMLRRIELRPDWSEPADHIHETGIEALQKFAAAVEWPAPTEREDLRPNSFPLLVWHPELGWGVAERMEDDRRVLVSAEGGRDHWSVNDGIRFVDLAIPEPPSEKLYKKAFDVFWHATLRRKRAIMLAVFATITINFIALGTSIFSMQVYDRVIPRGAFSTLWVLSAGVVVAILFDFLLRILRARMLERDAALIDREVSEFFFAKAMDVRLDARPPSVGTMAAQLKGLEQVRAMMSSTTVFVIADLPFALFFIFIVAKIGGIIATVTLISFPVSLLVALFMAKLIRADALRVQVSGNKKNGLLVEALDATETIKANRGHWMLLSRWNRLIDDVHHHELPMRDMQSVAASVFGTIQQLAYIALIAWGAVEVYANNMTMGGLLACSILAGRINGPLVGQLPNMVMSWTNVKISLGMLDSILALPGDKPEGVELLRPAALHGGVQLSDVEFVHPGARTGISIPKLEIKPGERIAIIGGIGSGKSTLLRLMSGLYAPAKGQVRLDGLDVSLIAGDILRNHVGYLPQDYRLVNGTLRDNLLLGLADPGDDAVMAAATQTGLAQIIATHPKGVDLPISEGGRGLSGGQRVVAGLTRLMLSDPGLWLLDEPTSNLDVDTEAKVLQAINRKVRPDATLVIVTHKLQLLNMVQRVIVMANGQIIMDGTPQEVVERLRGQPASPQPQQRTTAAVPVRTVPTVATA